MELCISDLGDLVDGLRKYKFQSTKWKQLGLKLGLHFNTLETIDAENQKTSDCLCDMLAAWLKLNFDYEKKGRPSWSNLVSALKDIQAIDTANNIEKEFC